MRSILISVDNAASDDRTLSALVNGRGAGGAGMCWRAVALCVETPADVCISGPRGFNWYICLCRVGPITGLMWFSPGRVGFQRHHLASPAGAVHSRRLDAARHPAAANILIVVYVATRRPGVEAKTGGTGGGVG